MPPSLSDFFPEEIKNNYIDRNLSPKSILILRIPAFSINYDKYVVLITASDCSKYIGAICINTNPTPQNNHVIIYKQDHSFLDYNSHMDCAGMIDLEISWLQELLAKEPERILGEITDAQHIEILQKLKVSKTILPAIKKKYNL